MERFNKIYSIIWKEQAKKLLYLYLKSTKQSKISANKKKTKKKKQNANWYWITSNYIKYN